MTKKTKPKQDAQGRRLRNGRAKSWLNKAILASTWGQTQVFLRYKARRVGKLMIEVPAFFLFAGLSANAASTQIMPIKTRPKSLPCKCPVGWRDIKEKRRARSREQK